MDPAKAQQALSTQGALLGQHHQVISALSDNSARTSQNIADLTQQLANLSTQVSALVTASTRQQTTDSHACDPEPFEEDLGKCRGFLLQRRLVFQQCPHYSSDSAKVNYMIGLLRGNALAWGQAMSTRNEISDLSYEELETQLKAVFDRPSYVTNVTDRLMTLRQGARSVAQFTVEFWTLVVEVGWNESPLMGVFRRGLNRQLQEAVLL